jgi:squalene-hopene/tetraprenyl-beta-curcumene cyclase
VAIERVAVVGAGLAGLSAALELKEAGLRVELFERSRLLGGRATSFEIDGIEVDNGQHVFLACCDAFIDFASRVGMADQLHLQARFEATILSRDGRTGRLVTAALPAPLHLLPSFAGYTQLTLREKAGIGRALLAAMRQRDRNETFEAWLERNHQGAGERRAFWDPFFIPALNAPFDRVGAADAMFVLRTAFLKDPSAARFGFSRVPLAHLAAAAAERLDAVTLSTSVISVEPNDDAVAVRTAGDSQDFDAVVLAVPPRQVERMLGDAARYEIESLEAYDPYPIIDVHLWHDGGSIGLDFAAALESPLQWIFEKKPGYLCCSFSSAAEYVQKSTNELEALAWSEAQAFLPQLKTANLIRTAVTRNPEATWLPKVNSKRTQQKTSHPRLAIAGSWTDTGWPDTMESAVRSGKTAATLLLAVQEPKTAANSPRPIVYDVLSDDVLSENGVMPRQAALVDPSESTSVVMAAGDLGRGPSDSKLLMAARSAVLSEAEPVEAESKGPEPDAEGPRQPIGAPHGRGATNVSEPNGPREPSQQKAELNSQTHVALGRAIDWLLYEQNEEGWWSGELETNVTMTAEHVLLFRFLGLPLDESRNGAIAHILNHQRSDGSWALYYDGPADLSTTIEAYVALKVLGVDPARDEMRRALDAILKGGGVVKARVFTKIWLALFGVYPWSGVPSLPPEIVYFPLWMPFNLYDFSCWARGTVAPLTIVVSTRPVRPLGVDVSEIVLPGTENELGRVTGPRHWLMLVERLQKLYEGLSRQPGREEARRRVAQWIVERQEADGSWGGIQPPWVYSLIALNLMGYGLDHPVMRQGIAGMKRFSVDDREGWRFLACMSPVWDTAWAVRALALAGFDATHPAMQRAVRWLLREQIPDDAPGDWRMKCKETRGNGWAFEFDNDAYPDIDDTTIVVLALLEGGMRDEVADAVERGRRWTLAMDSRNGAWAAFDRDNDRQLLYRMPFSDFGAMIDPPTEDVTAHVLEMMAALGEGVDHPAVVRGLKYLRDTQKPWGSWFGRWGVNHIYGTWCVLSALRALKTDQEMMDRAAAWLVSVQNPDGGWGESCHSYVDESFAGIGASTASQTAWAVLALQLAGQTRHPAVGAGLEYLCKRQRGDGTWDEPECTGTGFPRDFYINYHLYRHLFPTMALAMHAKSCHSDDLRRHHGAKTEGAPEETVKEPATRL